MRGSGEVEVGGHTENEALGDNDGVGVSAIGDLAGVLVREVVGEGEVLAELLEAGLAFGTGAVGVDQAAYGGEVTGLEFGNGGADLGYAADDFVSRDARVDGGHDFAPLIAGLVEVGVADATEKNLDLDIVAGGIAALNGGRDEGRSGAGDGIGFGFVHSLISTLLEITYKRLEFETTEGSGQSGILILPVRCLFLSMGKFSVGRGGDRR